MVSFVDVTKLEVRQSLPDLTKPAVTKAQLVRYAGASGDFNPIHTDDSEAHKSGLKGVIAQGPLIMGFVGQAICQWIPKRDLKRFKVRFVGTTFPGDVITIRATVTRKEEVKDHFAILCSVTARDQNDETKLLGEFEVSTNKRRGEVT